MLRTARLVWNHQSIKGPDSPEVFLMLSLQAGSCRVVGEFFFLVIMLAPGAALSCLFYPCSLSRRESYLGMVGYNIIICHLVFQMPADQFSERCHLNQRGTCS